MGHDQAEVVALANVIDIVECLLEVGISIKEDHLERGHLRHCHVEQDDVLETAGIGQAGRERLDGPRDDLAG